MNKKREEERFRLFLSHFSDFIRIHTLKYNLYKHGIDPDDIIQDIRFKLWKLISSEKKVSNYPSYIKKIVNSSVIDQIRKYRRDENIFAHERNKQISDNELCYSPASARMKSLEEALSKAVDLLKDSRRQVVKLYLLNLNVNEIAGYFNWTISKTRNLLYRGLSDLKDILTRMGIDK